MCACVCESERLAAPRIMAGVQFAATPRLLRDTPSTVYPYPSRSMGSWWAIIHFGIGMNYPHPHPPGVPPSTSDAAARPALALAAAVAAGRLRSSSAGPLGPHSRTAASRAAASRCLEASQRGLSGPSSMPGKVEVTHAYMSNGWAPRVAGVEATHA